MFAAVGLSTILGNHNNRFNAVTPVNIPFVPSPQVSDNMWCTNDCLIVVDPQTAVPTMTPTALPTEIPTTVPTNDPTEQITEEPTNDPSEIPTMNPTLENESDSNSKELLFTFLVVVITAFVY